MAKAVSKVRVGMSQTVTTDPSTMITLADFQAVGDYLPIGNAVSASGPTVSKPQIEHTDFDSVAREYFGDLAEAGEFTVELNKNFGDAGQAQVFSDAFTSGAQRATRVEKFDGANNLLETDYALCEVVGNPETSSQGEVYKSTVTLRISGLVRRDTV